VRVFVTGATGFIGREIAHHLQQNGHHVIALCRDPADLDLADVQKVRGDILQPAGWEPQLREAEACVHCVGILRAFPHKGITFEALHYQATLNLVRACGKVGVNRYIHLSANGVEKPATTEYMRSKAKAEQAVRSSSLEWTILRPSVVYGGRDNRQNFVSMLRDNLKKAPVFPYFGKGDYRLAPVSTWEVAETVRRCLDEPETRQKIIHLGGEEVYTYKALLHMLVEKGGHTAKLFGLPTFLGSAAAGVLGGFDWFPLNKEMLQMLLQGNDMPEGAATQQQLHVPPVSFQSWLGNGLIEPRAPSALTAQAESAPRTTQHLPQTTMPLQPDDAPEL
jgi:uncharacterized protein YbjT (DUF2867 family)